MSSQTVLILGAGASVGMSVAQKFASNEYKVAVASRSINPDLAKVVNASTKVDFSAPSSVKDVYKWVKSEIGVPSVVIYNASPSNSNVACRANHLKAGERKSLKEIVEAAVLANSN